MSVSFSNIRTSLFFNQFTIYLAILGQLDW
ncbi:Protein of unknown function [Bacillus cytotoxicus]|uniref:Uncharacterized protein n=1 Tax=Bacillus cytotoxicus TaxID=580165 RepID=A0AAX2CJI2_9BACI|nr:Protein of unknown function [Bacillus cytotoxicus]SCN40556.1 Protein of unknown function [Bacillus cytotoxicus]